MRRLRTAVLVSATVPMAVLAIGCSDSSQDMAQDKTSQAAASERPNVILILTDDLDTKLLEDNLDSYPNSFNEDDVSDKPPWIQRRKKLNSESIEKMDRLYRDQARSMLAVDEMVGSIKDSLRQSGNLDNTYIFFTSDNGYHMGHHRLRDGKRTAYEEDIRIPWIVQGPGVPKGAVRDEMILNNDFAPTAAELAGAEVPYEMDGSSLSPLLRGENPSWRERFLIEASARERLRRPAFDAVRSENHVLVDYTEKRDELYDFSRDPFQLENYVTTAPKDLKRGLRRDLATLRECAGASCRKAEGFQEVP